MKRKNLSNLVFLGLLLVVFGVGVATFLKDKTLYSMAENRELNGFEHFTWNSFAEGAFQDNFELALSDQFFGSEQIKVNYAQFLKNLPTFGIKENICHNKYIELKGNDRRRGTFNCEEYIVYMPDPLTEEKKLIVEQNIDKYNHVNKLADTYYYFVDDPSSFDFEKNWRVNDYYGLLKKELKGEKGLSRLDYNNYDGYKKFFYKNDHHWDYRGSYQGFIDVAKMLGIKNVAAPTGEYTNHENFFGSYARVTSTYDYPEIFIFYEFDIPKHKTYINGVEKKYNHFEEYKNHDYGYDRAMNYYAYVYGDDYAEIVFDFDQPKKENLLIVSNSYSNAIDELVAQYYDKTYVIDLRCYKETFKKDFEISKYLADKDIDKVLILMSPTFIWAEEPNRGLEL